jgi:hypothetical protein
MAIEKAIHVLNTAVTAPIAGGLNLLGIGILGVSAWATGIVIAKGIQKFREEFRKALSF